MAKDHKFALYFSLGKIKEHTNDATISNIYSFFNIHVIKHYISHAFGATSETVVTASEGEGSLNR